MAGRIYVLSDESKLITMEEAPYDSESLLQELLADHPDLLAGDQTEAEEPRKWLLVTREMLIPGEQGGAGRWSLDHLFLDQDAIPTLVEVKRTSDTRIRREVVGQMLVHFLPLMLTGPLGSHLGSQEWHGVDDPGADDGAPMRRSSRPWPARAGWGLFGPADGRAGRQSWRNGRDSFPARGETDIAKRHDEPLP